MGGSSVPAQPSQEKISGKKHELSTTADTAEACELKAILQMWLFIAINIKIGLCLHLQGWYDVLQSHNYSFRKFQGLVNMRRSVVIAIKWQPWGKQWKKASNVWVSEVNAYGLYCSIHIHLLCDLFRVDSKIVIQELSIWSLCNYSQSYIPFLNKDFIYLFLERGEGGEKERKRNIDMPEKHGSVASCTPPTGEPGL